VGLGSNLDDPATQVRNAFAALSLLPATRLVLRSSLYGSKPLGPVRQADFVNAVAGLLTQLDADAFFARLRQVEGQLGRAPTHQRWGPRRIDLDLLLFGQQRREGEELRLPHPGIVERNFVLYPLAEVAPELPVPGHGLVGELAARVSPEGIWRLDTQAAES
jgi:2-amino-4-hydroxy-6-hydroxymethyldihydropteridine diphosphokinase